MLADLLKIPNLLTLARLALAPVVIVLFRGEHHVAAAVVFVLAMVTDCFDGWAARRFNQQTTIGLYLDPVVDKIVILALLYELAHAGQFSMAIPHLFLARELLQNAIRATAAAKGNVVGANWMGKTKAFLQIVLITWGLLAPVLPITTTAIAIAAWALLALTWVFFGIFFSWNSRNV